LWVEGDDVLGYASSSLAEHQALIEANYRELGYTSKLKFVSSGRAEFIGAHFTIDNGVVVGDWVPNFVRYLAKLGVYAGRRPCPESYVARCCSIACMFAGRLPFAADMFHNLAKSHLQGARRNAEILIDAYTDEDKAFGEGLKTLQSILDTTARMLLVDGKSAAVQRDILSGSIGADLSGTDMERLQILADRMSRDLDDQEAYALLPLALKN